jgi:catechol 2,3-dioxygenase-like lactoylglutathione lyase family enzyme
VLGTPDPRRLAAFYQELLGWVITSADADWVTLRPGDDGAGLSFQTEAHHVAPAWPDADQGQQMQMHLDVVVDDLESAVARATELGAALEAYQPQDDVRVLRDPDGHLFCLFER